jgi:hypothetical protein
MMLALHGAKPIPEYNPSKEKHWGRRKLKRNAPRLSETVVDGKADCGVPSCRRGSIFLDLQGGTSLAAEWRRRITEQEERSDTP